MPACPLDFGDLVSSRLFLDLRHWARACQGGAGTCLAGANASLASPAGPKGQGPMFVASSLAEDLLLEYAEGMPAADVGWGRAGGEAGIAAVSMTKPDTAYAIFA